MLIFKIANASDWMEAMRAGRFEGSAHDRADGFIHFSTGPQLAETLQRYYAGQDGLLLVVVDEAQLGDALKWEYAPSRGEDFPHLFGPLPLRAVTRVIAIERDADGAHIVPSV
jgi:uncharacterized protein (DUF952 family)